MLTEPSLNTRLFFTFFSDPNGLVLELYEG